ncbi:MAG: N-acetylglucosamine-6-phosphate deacetylase [Lachnospiraceae bacterium]|jgi:N-acetylglucosamine-6-phosphate deacetylase
MKLIKDIAVYTGNGVIKQGYVRFGRTIADVGPMRRFSPEDSDEAVETGASAVIPGFIDVHSHGAYGYDAMDASPEEICRMVRRVTAREGVTSFFCTTMTQTEEAIASAMKNIAAAAEMNPVIQGIHLEGPFISPEFRGAQMASCIRRPDTELLGRLNELSGNRIRVVTYAPEEADPAFEEWCAARRIVLSAGHSNAHYAELKNSLASHITHLYNAQRGLKHREPGVTGYGLLTEGVTCELICDGIHIMPEMIDLAYRLKGSRGIELITDSMRAKGLPDGVSELGGQTVYVSGKRATLADGTIAGSVLPYIDAFRNIQKFTSATMEDAVRMTSGNQAAEFGLSAKGAIAVGKDADMVLLTDSLEIDSVYSLGEKASDPED